MMAKVLIVGNKTIVARKAMVLDDNYEETDGGEIHAIIYYSEQIGASLTMGYGKNSERRDSYFENLDIEKMERIKMLLESIIEGSQKSSLPF